MPTKLKQYTIRLRETTIWKPSESLIVHADNKKEALAMFWKNLASRTSLYGMKNRMNKNITIKEE